jgi:hypothetical protein
MAEIVGEYKVKVDKAVSDLDKVSKEWKDVDQASIKAGNDGQKALKGVESSSKSLISTLKNVAGAVGLAFGVQQLISFGKEAVQVAAKAEGIQRAFDKLNSPNLLNDLRKATRGTVSDLDLMQKAVQANNFKLPLDKLAQLFQFATNRAIETGESVDYLVESIVLGISRKSIPILDNLGISSVQIQEEMKKTGDFAQAAFNIVSQSMEESGDVADTTATKLARLTAGFQNFKNAAGDALISIGYSLAEDLGLIYRNQSAIDSLSESWGKLSTLGVQKEFEAQRKKLDELNTSYTEFVTIGKNSFDPKIAAEIEKKLGAELILQKEIVDALEDQVKARKELLGDGQDNLEYVTPEQLERLKQTGELTKEEIRNVFFLQKAIADLKQERQEEGTTRERILAINGKLIPLEAELAELLGKEAKEAKAVYEAMELRKVAMSESVPIVIAMTDTINGLNELLKEQKDILNSSPEFSKQYKDAIVEIDKLQKKLDEFNDDFIDPKKGFPNAAPGGDGSATGLGLLGGGGESLPPIGDDELAEWMAYADAVIGINELITSAIIAGHNKEIESLDRQLAAGDITRQEYDKKRRALERKKAADEKASAIFTAVINTATAVLAALNTQPFLPLGPIMAGIAGALGAVQIGVIAAQPLPAFATGVIGLKGEGTETSDSIHARLSKGESVMTAKETKRFESELWAMRKGTFDQLIMSKYVKPMIDESLFNGFADLGKSADLNGLTANLKDHNIIAGLDRLRQSQTSGFKYLAKEMKSNRQPKRGGYV